MACGTCVKAGSHQSLSEKDSGITGIEWDQEQNGLLVALSAGVPTCLAYIPFG